MRIVRNLVRPERFELHIWHGAPRRGEWVYVDEFETIAAARDRALRIDEEARLTIAC